MARVLSPGVWVSAGGCGNISLLSTVVADLESISVFAEPKGYMASDDSYAYGWSWYVNVTPVLHLTDETVYNKIVTFDVTNKGAPSRVGLTALYYDNEFHSSGAGIQTLYGTCAMSGDDLYVTSNEGFVDGTILQIFDRSTPTSPSLVSNTTVPDVATVRLVPFTVGGNKYLAYCANNYYSDVYTYDVTNTASVTLASDNVFADLPNDLDVHGSVLYIALTTGIEAWDYSNPASPSFLGRGDAEAGETTVAIRAIGTTVYSSHDDGTYSILYAWDFSDPTTPVRLGSIAPDSTATGITSAIQLAADSTAVYANNFAGAGWLQGICAQDTSALTYGQKVPNTLTATYDIFVQSVMNVTSYLYGWAVLALLGVDVEAQLRIYQID